MYFSNWVAAIRNLMLWAELSIPTTLVATLALRVSALATIAFMATRMGCIATSASRPASPTPWARHPIRFMAVTMSGLDMFSWILACSSHSAFSSILISVFSLLKISAKGLKEPLFFFPLCKGKLAEEVKSDKGGRVAEAD